MFSVMWTKIDAHVGRGSTGVGMAPYNCVNSVELTFCTRRDRTPDRRASLTKYRTECRVRGVRLPNDESDLHPYAYGTHRRRVRAPPSDPSPDAGDRRVAQRAPTRHPTRATVASRSVLRLRSPVPAARIEPVSRDRPLRADETRAARNVHHVAQAHTTIKCRDSIGVTRGRIRHPGHEPPQRPSQIIVPILSSLNSRVSLCAHVQAHLSTLAP